MTDTPAVRPAVRQARFYAAARLVTQQDLWEACRVNRSTVQRWLSGEHPPPARAYRIVSQLLRDKAATMLRAAEMLDETVPESA